MTNEIIKNGWYAVQVGDNYDLDTGSENYNDALKIANEYANNSDYDGQEIRIVTCDIYENGTLSECTNEEIIREGVLKMKKDLQDIKEEMLDFTIETIGSWTEEAQEKAEKHIELYANDYTRQHNEDYDWQLTEEEIDEVVNYIIANY